MSVQLGVSGVTLVPQATGYGLLVGLGVAFCGVILVAIKVQRAYLAEDSATSEMFMVANRSVGTGLTASAVFSSWMWINETVFSAAMCYRFGLAVPLVSSDCLSLSIWYLAGAKETHMLISRIVVGNWSLLSDSPDGGPRGFGQDPGPLCSYVPGDHTNPLWQDWTHRIHSAKPIQQRIWMRLDDPHRLASDIWNLGNALCRRHHPHPTWR